MERGQDVQAVKMSQATHFYLQDKRKGWLRAIGYLKRRDLGDCHGEGSHLRHKERRGTMLCSREGNLFFLYASC